MDYMEPQRPRTDTCRIEVLSRAILRVTERLEI